MNRNICRKNTDLAGKIRAIWQTLFKWQGIDLIFGKGYN